MRFIDDLRDCHKGKTIWIQGIGQSLCDFPRKFFDKKISIALNWAVIAFPNCTYWHGHHECVREYLRDEKPEFLRKSIILYPFPGPFRHGRITQPKEFFGELVSKPIWMKFWDTRPIPKSAFEEAIKYIVEKRTAPRGYRASMTVAHTAMQAAAVMGAKRIVLVGCEHRGSYARCYGMYDWRKACGGFEIFPIHDSRYQDGTRWSAEIFAKYGIEVIRYYHKDGPFYKKGYEKISWEGGEKR